MVTTYTDTNATTSHIVRSREETIMQYYPLVRYVVTRMSAQGMGAVADIEDLMGYGSVGLIQAVDRFDDTRGVNFQTYAISRIRGAIIDALRVLDPQSRGARQRARKLAESRSSLAVELGREPSRDEVLVDTGFTAAQYRDADDVLSTRVVPLNLSPDETEREEGWSVTDIVDEDASVTANMEHQELLGEVAEGIRNLPERDRLVVNLRYKDGLSLAEIARVLEISESRASQLHNRAIRRLREQVLPRQAA